MFVNQNLSQLNYDHFRNAYSELYSQDRWLSDRSSLFRWLMRRLGPERGSKLLDVACGNGQMAAIVREAGVSYVGIDFVHSAVAMAPNATTVTADGETLPFLDDSFDYVTNIGSLEHFHDLSRGIGEMHRVLRSNGLALILVPNAYSLTWNILRVWRTGDLADDDGQPIQRFATRNSWQRLLSENGLRPVKVLGYERVWPRTRADWHVYFAEPKEVLLALLTPLLPLNAKRSLVFICRKTFP